MDELLRFGRKTMTHSMMKGPYENHYYRLGSVIRNTVSQAQDTLYRLKLGRETQQWLDVVERMRPAKSMGPPQTLGELCLEVSRPVVDKAYQEDGLTIEFVDMYPKVVYDALRRVLYHKHKDPKEERLYRLIDAIRRA